MDYDYEAGVVPFVLEADHTIKSLIFEIKILKINHFANKKG